jgi:hypothetical protein
MPKMPPPLAIYPSRVRAAVLAAISALLLVLPVIALLLFRAQIEDVKAASYRLYGLIWIGSGLFVLLGLAGLAFNLRQLAWPKAVVTISSQGIEPLWYGLIRWEEIDRIAKVRCKGQWLLGIYPKDSDELLSGQSGLRRSLIQRAIEQGFPPVYVTQLALPMAVDEVLAEIRRYTDVPISKVAS